MRLLFKNATLFSGSGHDGSICAAVEGERFTYIGEGTPDGEYDRIIDCRGRLLAPAFYNTHSHAAMTLFRGYADDMPLERWLNEKILPAEDSLTRESVYWASLLAAAEMISGGIVSFSDMYMFEDATARAVLECGMKANLARGLVSFDENVDMAADTRFSEAAALWREYNGAGGGRIKIDIAPHAEYTNVRRACAYAADYCIKNDIRMQIHLSETRGEHERCIAKRGVTPARFFAECGVLDTALTAAHCVWVSDEDIELLTEKRVYVSHNPTSNLKLGSGIMPYAKLAEHGISVSFGTDGAASNNSLNIMKEMQLAALLHKGAGCDAEIARAADMLACATRNGAAAQGREDCGKIEVGYRADAVLYELDDVNTAPLYCAESALVYSADRSNIKMTLCDGRILYEDGEYKSIDIERVKYNLRQISAALRG